MQQMLFSVIVKATDYRMWKIIYVCFFSDAGTITCALCNPGFFSNKSGAIACLPCPPGTGGFVILSLCEIVAVLLLLLPVSCYSGFTSSVL